MSHQSHQSHQRLASRRVYDGRLLRVDRDRVRLPGGGEADLEIVRHPGASAVVPFISATDVLLVRQFRYAAGGTILEVPAGTLDPGEAPESCARREVGEETGHRPGRLQPLGWIYTTPGFTDEVIHLWAAFDLAPTAQRLDEDEVLSVVRMPFDAALAAARDGGIVDGKSICALMRAREALRA